MSKKQIAIYDGPAGNTLRLEYSDAEKNQLSDDELARLAVMVESQTAALAAEDQLAAAKHAAMAAAKDLQDVRDAMQKAIPVVTFMDELKRMGIHH